MPQSPVTASNLGRHLAAWRITRGHTQEQIARLAGICKGRLSEYETGARVPTLKTLYKIARALNIVIFMELRSYDPE